MRETKDLPSVKTYYINLWRYAEGGAIQSSMYLMNYDQARHNLDSLRAKGRVIVQGMKPVEVFE
ncbi:hypothetical protein SXHG_00034 [Synechococcus phage MRHenn-2013a]|nr:hypothetical protein SXHG_00034 [Synechococcus phage MRHenn-2013a]